MENYTRKTMSCPAVRCRALVYANLLSSNLSAASYLLQTNHRLISCCCFDRPYRSLSTLEMKISFWSTRSFVFNLFMWSRGTSHRHLETPHVCAIPNLWSHFSSIRKMMYLQLVNTAVVVSWSFVASILSLANHNGPITRVRLLDMSLSRKPTQNIRCCANSGGYNTVSEICTSATHTTYCLNYKLRHAHWHILMLPPRWPGSGSSTVTPVLPLASHPGSKRSEFSQFDIRSFSFLEQSIRISLFQDRSIF